MGNLLLWTGIGAAQKSAGSNVPDRPHGAMISLAVQLRPNELRAPNFELRHVPFTRPQPPFEMPRLTLSLFPALLRIVEISSSGVRLRRSIASARFSNPLSCRNREIVRDSSAEYPAYPSRAPIKIWDRASGRPLKSIDICTKAAYSRSNPWLVNFKVRLFSVTVRTT
jgi:hypothetical protein